MNDTVIRKPVITEKSLNETKNNRYTFEVSLNATKSEIKEAIKALFNVDVEKVTTTKNASHSHRAGRLRKMVQTQPKKKAIIELKKGQSIKLFETTG